MGPERDGPERRRRDPVLLLCLLLVLAPFVVGIVRACFVHWTPVGDWALIELRTRGVGGSHTPLVGPYSRFGWSHPGPALFFALAVPYRLFGSQAHGLLVGTLLVNAASALGIVLLAWRRGGRALMVATAIALMVLCHSVGAEFLRDPWNPYITVLPFTALVFLAWSVACGDRWMLPVAVLVASFIVQSHVGYAALVVTVLVVAIAWRVVERVRQRGARADERDSTRRRTLAITGVTIAVAVAAWLPPLLDQIVNPGNLQAIWKFFGKRHKTPTVDTALRLVGRAVSVPGSWATGHESVVTSGLFIPAIAGFFLPLGLLAIAAGIVVAVRRRDRDALAFLVVVTAALVAGVYSISHVAGPLAAYLVRWLLVLGMLSWLAAAWAFWPWLRTLRPGRTVQIGLAALAAALLVVPTAANAVDAVHARAPWYRAGLVEQRLARDTVAHLSSQGHPVLLESKHEQWWTWGLAPRLEAAGIPVASRQTDVLYFGRHRVALKREARVGVMVVVGPDARTSGRPAGGRLLASYSGPPVPFFPLGKTARYSAVINLAEDSLLSDTVAIYEVPL